MQAEGLCKKRNIQFSSGKIVITVYCLQFTLGADRQIIVIVYFQKIFWAIIWHYLKNIII